MGTQHILDTLMSVYGAGRRISDLYVYFQNLLYKKCHSNFYIVLF